MKLGPNQKKWIKALKSGEYKQDKYRLGNFPEGMCCLGVANHVLNLGLDPSLLTLSGDNFEKLGLRSNSGKILPPLILPDDTGNDSVMYLTTLNDRLGWSFEKIADWIEKNPERVFKKSI